MTDKEQQMNLQELLKERERIDKELEKYDAEMQRRKELKEWKERFEIMTELPIHTFLGYHQVVGIDLPSHIREIIVNALQKEIDKLEKE